MLASTPAVIIVNIVKDFFFLTGKLIDHIQLHDRIMSVNAEQLACAIIYDLSR